MSCAQGAQQVADCQLELTFWEKLQAAIVAALQPLYNMHFCLTIVQQPHCMEVYVQQFYSHLLKIHRFLSIHRFLQEAEL